MNTVRTQIVAAQALQITIPTASVWSCGHTTACRLTVATPSAQLKPMACIDNVERLNRTRPAYIIPQ